MSDVPDAAEIKHRKQHFWKIRKKEFRDLLIERC